MIRWTGLAPWEFELPGEEVAVGAVPGTAAVHLGLGFQVEALGRAPPAGVLPQFFGHLLMRVWG